MSERLSPQQALEKLYRDHKARFEQWKEQNKELAGTEVYTAYVRDFEAWKKDVEFRLEMIHAVTGAEGRKDQNEAQVNAEATAVTEVEHKMGPQLEEQQKLQLEAEAYARNQQPYLAHHQAAMQKVKTVEEATAAQAASANAPGEKLDLAHMAETVKQMAQTAIAMMNHDGEVEGGAYQWPGSQFLQQPIVPPLRLWGSDRIQYDSSDPMYKKWGLRAAPPYYKPASHLTPPDYQPATSWLFLERMKEEELVLPSDIDLPPSPN